MTYNDTTNLNGIIQQVERYINMGSTWISGDTTRLKEFTSYANKTLRKVWHLIFLSHGVWKYDDSNETDLPQATTNLVDSQKTYTLPSTALTVQRVECKNSNGDWFLLKQVMEQQIPDAIDEWNNDDCEPVYYRLVGNVIELFPATNYASTGGLKVYFDRDVHDFVYNDTTAVPGFASPYHEIIPVGMAIEWLKIKNPNNPTLQFLREEYARLEVDIKKFYSLRNKSLVRVLRRAFQSFK